MKNRSGNASITDDCMILEQEGYTVKLVEGDYENIKITTQDDLVLMKQFLAHQEKEGKKE